MTKARDIASAVPAPSTVSSAELGHLDGVTSAIQTQVDAKTAKATLTTTGDIYYASAASTPDRIGIGSTSQVLTVAGGIPSWATPAAGGTRGLQQIIPTSVAVGGGTATVGANGMITATSATTNISINGCFTSTYTNYQIVLDMSAAASYTSFNIRMRVAGTDNTTANSYKIAYYSAANTGGLSGGAITSDKWQTVGFIGTDAVNGGNLTFYRPFLAEKTGFTGSTIGNAAGDIYNNGSGGNHLEATSYDGFSILTTQTLTGRILIYGWSE